MIEFYGEIALPCKKRADKLRKRHYAVWTSALTLAMSVFAVLSGVTGGNFILFIVFACLLAAVSVFLFVAPQGKSFGKEKWLFRVQIEEGKLRLVQYAQDREIKKERELKKIKKVVLSGGCYYLYAPNAGNLILCQRNLLKKGTFEEFESLFSGRLRKVGDE